ncbi:family 1 glycosylhydrolase [Pelotalea chapellei]|uniref:dTDP-4-dehydrorhamnose reductase n=1 Tax=Pelotalea chapellei TaxID=44671 RepID=A0ABS5UCP9_9BACT|nr:sugar nucleotide-binding protein [Pelotalea chapellei]
MNKETEHACPILSSPSIGYHLRPEIWGGVECTVNRVRDTFHNQLLATGHWHRADDLERFASLGIRTMRYPILWELVSPDSLDTRDWRWTDERLAQMKSLGITPIAGLLHHGSGPTYTSLVDPAFPRKLARFAQLVAERYPWLETFTPINEPLTTARFSGMYGHWFPHGCDCSTFIRAIILQCKAIGAAMAAIRQVIPQAKLIVTEDISRSYSTDMLRYQADFENERRWLSLDLLAGRVNHHHPLYSWLTGCGATEAELDSLSGCEPDVIGINYYLTSDRMLDERMHLYPKRYHGGNGRQDYADAEAVRASPDGIQGHHVVLREAWQRYAKPVAITEAHISCTREEQVRWFMEAWQAGLDLCREGVPVRAVTAWSLLGACDWNTLVTSENNHYEPGVYDVRAPVPRPTMLTRMIRELNEKGTFHHPSLNAPGWWRRPERLFAHCRPKHHDSEELEYGNSQPLLIIGSSGTLGKGFGRICTTRGLHHHLLTRQQVDITDSASVTATLRKYRPWAVVNAAGFVRVDDAEDNLRQCFKENTIGPLKLAAACKALGVRLVTFSSDLVFDGTKGRGYHEQDAVGPLNVYGLSKAEAERHVLALMKEALVIRTSAFFGPWDRYNFITSTLGALARGEKVQIADDLIISPTYLPDLINTALDLLLDEESGIWHISNSGALSWAELAYSSATMAGMDTDGIICCRSNQFGYRARRPRNSTLTSELHNLLPTYEDALGRYFEEILTDASSEAVVAGG